MPDYYDGERPATAVERTVAADPWGVWALITDPNLPAHFSAEFQGGEWLDGVTAPAVGARFRGRNCNEFMGRWSTICHVVACDPPRRYAWAVDDVDTPNATWQFTLTPEADRTIVRYEVVIGPGPSGLTEAIQDQPERRDVIIAWRLDDLRGNMQAVVDGVAVLAEELSTT